MIIYEFSHSKLTRQCLSVVNQSPTARYANALDLQNHQSNKTVRSFSLTKLVTHIVVLCADISGLIIKTVAQVFTHTINSKFYLQLSNMFAFKTGIVRAFYRMYITKRQIKLTIFFEDCNALPLV